MARLLKAENLIRLIIEGFEVLNWSLLRNIKMVFLQKILKKEDGLSAKKINEKKSTSGEARSYQPYDICTRSLK